MDFFIKLIDTIKWPSLVLIVTLIFYKPVKSLIERIKSVKTGKLGIETDPLQIQENSEKKDKLVANNNQSKVELIEKALNLFSYDTREAFKQTIKKETELDDVLNEKEKNEILFRYSEYLYIQLVNERTYSHIFGSQIRLLIHLNSAFNQTVDGVKFFFEEAVKENAEIGRYGYDKYLQFLSSHQLIIIDDNEQISITWRGRDFLKWMVEKGLTDFKPN
ncbi:MAG: hypothetical protein ABW007_17500 [Chitinophagaceae bacterium]